MAEKEELEMTVLKAVVEQLNANCKISTPYLVFLAYNYVIKPNTTLSPSFTQAIGAYVDSGAGCICHHMQQARTRSSNIESPVSMVIPVALLVPGLCVLVSQIRTLAKS